MHIHIFIENDLSHNMTKPTKWRCVQRRPNLIRVFAVRSAWASAQSDQSLRCPHEESFGPKLRIERTAKTLIRLGGWPGWSELSRGAQSFCWFCREAAHLVFLLIFSNVRQAAQFVKGLIGRKVPVKDIVKDMEVDQEANKCGRSGSDRNKYRSKGLDKNIKFKVNQKSGTYSH